MPWPMILHVIAHSMKIHAKRQDRFLESDQWFHPRPQTKNHEMRKQHHGGNAYTEDSKSFYLEKEEWEKHEDGD